MPTPASNQSSASRVLAPIALRLLFVGAFISLLGGALFLFGPHTPPDAILRPEMAFRAILTIGLVFFSLGLLGTVLLRAFKKK
jgi:hypothetical protein